MTHLDLFSGIGGFSLAFDNIFHEQKNEHIFCEIDPFCQAVIRKHWPEAQIIGDIRTLASDTGGVGLLHSKSQKLPAESEQQAQRQSSTGIHSPFLLTGGFPCQPFSQAGRRKGTGDDRHLWPYMLSVIKSFQPEWVIAENVRGILTIEHGMVFEQVCLDLEAAGYEVQPLIIPAVAVNAPHRRDRVWFVANRRQQHGSKGRDEGMEKSEAKRSSCKSDIERCGEDDANTTSEGLERGNESKTARTTTSKHSTNDSWNQNWLEVATRLCRVDDGLSTGLDKARLIDYIVRNGQPDQSQTAKTLSTTDSSDTMRIMRLYIKVAEASLQGTSGMEKGTNPMPEMPHRGRTRQRNMGARKQEENQVRDMQPMVSTDTNGKEQDLLEELPIGIGEAKRYVAVASQRNPRLKALGNAIVPQVAEEIMKAIKEMP